MIVLVGSHGVGKSTLLAELKRQRPDLIISDGFSRVISKFNKDIDNKLEVEESQLLINRISDRNWPVFTQIENLCVTRSPLDHYAYSKALGYKKLAQERLDLFNTVDKSKVKFFYIPIEFDLEDDGVRYSDPDFQNQVDVLLLHALEKTNTPITATLSGSIEERVNEILKHI